MTPHIISNGRQTWYIVRGIRDWWNAPRREWVSNGRLASRFRCYAAAEAALERIKG